MKITKPTALLFSLVLAACSEKKDTTDQSKNSEAEGDLASLVLSSAPEEPIDIADLRKSAKPGETVTFTGHIIGSKAVFMDSRAVMIMGDPKKLTSCNLRPGDPCETPWDVCCDDQDVINASIVTIQVVDNEGKPLKSGLKDLGGMKELSAVTVVGEVHDSSNENNMLINATGFYVHP